MTLLAILTALAVVLAWAWLDRERRIRPAVDRIGQACCDMERLQVAIGSRFRDSIRRATAAMEAWRVAFEREDRDVA